MSETVDSHQTKSLLAWCFNTITSPGSDTASQVHWHLEAIGIGVDSKDYLPVLPELIKLLDGDVGYPVAQLIIATAMWQPDAREMYFLNSAMVMIHDDAIAEALAA